MTFQEDLKKKHPDRIYPKMKNLHRAAFPGNIVSYRSFLRNIADGSYKQTASKFSHLVMEASATMKRKSMTAF